MKQITVSSEVSSERLRNFKGRNGVKIRVRRPVGCGNAEMGRRLEGFRVARCTLKGESFPPFGMLLRQHLLRRCATKVKGRNRRSIGLRKLLVTILLLISAVGSCAFARDTAGGLQQFKLTV
jgi:hypothetical protein